MFIMPNFLTKVVVSMLLFSLLSQPQYPKAILPLTNTLFNLPPSFLRRVLVQGVGQIVETQMPWISPTRRTVPLPIFFLLSFFDRQALSCRCIQYLRSVWPDTLGICLLLLCILHSSIVICIRSSMGSFSYSEAQTITFL